MGEGSLPYMSPPAESSLVYSNCTTAKTGLPLTPSTLGILKLDEAHAVRAIGEELRLVGRGCIQDRRVVDVVIAAGQDRAALAVRHLVAR